MIPLGGYPGRVILGPSGRFGVRPAEFAALGSFASPLAACVDSGDDNTEFAWVIQGLPISGVLVCNDDGGMSHTGAADGSYTTHFNLYTWAPGGAGVDRGDTTFTTTFGSGGATLSAALTEAASAADAMAAASSAVALIAEAAAAAEAQTTSPQLAAVLAEAVSASEALAALAALAAQVATPAAAADQLQAAAQIGALLAEAAAAVEAVNATTAATHNVAVAEAAAALEALAATLGVITALVSAFWRYDVPGSSLRFDITSSKGEP